MRSPILAMLWENWRLTRAEVVGRLPLTFVAAAVVLGALGPAGPDAAPDPGAATSALFIGALFHACLWLSIAKLNGGRFLDGYRPGFPLHLLYTRPVRTAVLVGVPMAYAAAMAAALYLAWALLMRMVFDVPFPLLPVAAWIVALHVVQAAAYWSTRSRVVQWLGSFAAFGGCLVLALRRVGGGAPVAPRLLPDQWPMLFDYSWVDYSIIVAIALISFGVTVAGVARQRRGDARVSLPRTAGSAGSPDWLAGLFRLPCPTSSATRAQLWFELKSSGLTVLVFGFLFAIAMPLLYAAGSRVEFFRAAALGVPLLSVLAFLSLGGNAFGIRRKQGYTHASVFEATQASRTGSLAGLKVLVRSVCVLAAAGMIAASVWLSVPLASGWPDAAREAVQMLGARDRIAATFSAWSGIELAALLVFVFGAVAVLVTVRAALEALFARYRRRMIVVFTLLLLYGLVFVLGRTGGKRESRWETEAEALFGAMSWIVAAAIVFATFYLIWRAVAERLLSPRETGGVVLISAVFVAAWVTLLSANGVRLGELPMTAAAGMLSPVLLPLLASVLAPWSLSRVRHI